MGTGVARLHSLRSVQLRVPTVVESTEFYSEVWGLSVVEQDRGDTWLRGTGENHHVLQLTHAERHPSHRARNDGERCHVPASS